MRSVSRLLLSVLPADAGTHSASNRLLYVVLRIRPA